MRLYNNYILRNSYKYKHNYKIIILILKINIKKKKKKYINIYIYTERERNRNFNRIIRRREIIIQSSMINRVSTGFYRKLAKPYRLLFEHSSQTSIPFGKRWMSFKHLKTWNSTCFDSFWKTWKSFRLSSQNVEHVLEHKHRISNST